MLIHRFSFIAIPTVVRVLGCGVLLKQGKTRLQANRENISIRACGDLPSRGSREFADAYNVPLVSVMMEQADLWGDIQTQS